MTLENEWQTLRLDGFGLMYMPTGIDLMQIVIVFGLWAMLVSRAMHSLSVTVRYYARGLKSFYCLCEANSETMEIHRYIH
jgi:hypothetical protein